MKLKILVIAAWLLSIAAVDLSAQTPHTLRRRCPASATDARATIERDGDINLIPCSGKDVLINGSVIGAGTTEASTTEVLTGTNTTKYASANSIAALWEQGSNVASAGTISLGEGGYFAITGTTTITDIDFATDTAGRRAWVRFSGVLTLTHNATTLILPTGANITTAAGDTAEIVSEGSDAIRVVSYQRASGAALVGGGGSGDVVGPASATDNGIARFDGTTGKLLQDTSAAVISDTGSLTLGANQVVNIGALEVLRGTASGSVAQLGSASITTVLERASTQVNTNIGGNVVHAVNSAGVDLASGHDIRWSSNATDANDVKDTGLIRSSAGVVAVTDGAAGNGNLTVGGRAYNATTWNGSLLVPTEDAIRDQLETGITIATTPVTSGTNGRILFQAGGVVQQSANFRYGGSDFEMTGNALITGNVTVTDEAYNATTWNGSTQVPTKNAVRDQIEAISAAGISDGDKGDITVASSGTVWTLDGKPSGTIVGHTDTQTLTNKTIALGSNTVSGTIAQFNTAVTDADLATIAGSETLTNKTLTAPRLADLGFIADANGNELLIADTVASAVNEITIANAATGNGPTISATGGDTNISVNIVPKGTGTVNIGATGAAGSLGLADSDQSHYLNITTTSNLTADRNLTFAVGDAARTITLAGNVSTAGDLTTAGANALTLTTSATTNATLPAGTTNLSYTVTSGTSALGTSAITSGACATVVTTSATGTATTDVISWGFNSDVTGTTGYNPATGVLTIYAYPSANNVNFKVCNLTAGSITPGAVTLNWRIIR